MATVTTDDVDAIRRQMAKIRSELHEDVRGVVEAANSAWNWRGYITAYPMLSLAVAAGVGYLVVPRRRKTAAETPVVVVQKAADAVQSAAQAPEKDRRKKSLISAGVGMLATLALKSAQNYALHYAQQWLAEKQMQFMHGAEAQGLVPTQMGMPMGMAPAYGQQPGYGAYPPQAGRPQGPMPGRPGGPTSPWPGGA